MPAEADDWFWDRRSPPAFRANERTCTRSPLHVGLAPTKASSASPLPCPRLTFCTRVSEVAVSCWPMRRETTMRSAFFVGAGCSYGTLANHDFFPPLARQFGGQLAQRVSGWRRKYPELAKVARHLQISLPEAGLEDIWTCIDYHAKFRGTFPTNWSLKRTVPELKRALLQLYGSTCDDAARTLRLSNRYTLGSVVNQIEAGDTLISFNYDTLVERLFMKRGSSHRLLHCSGPPGNGVVRFAKPHGSSSWNLYDLGHDVTDGTPAISSLEQVDPNNEPLLLGAVPLKSELIIEVQCYYRTHRIFEVVLLQWRALAEAVRDADRLVVLGYSFPKEDAYGRFFFREAMRERQLMNSSSDRPPLRVEYFEVPERAEQTACSICAAFPGELNIRYQGKVTAAPKSAFTKR